MLRTRPNSIASVGLLAALAAGGAALTGCGPSYTDQRPPMDQLDPRDRGLQSKDVLQASDRLAMDLLSLPDLNDSREQWLIVVDHVEDNTRSRLFTGDFDIFLQRLRVNVQRQGRGRVRIISNRRTFYDVRSRELESERQDDFGQGEPGGRRAQDARDPDFALRATAMDLPNRGTVYYNLAFELIDLRTRESVWGDQYEVRTAR